MKISAVAKQLLGLSSYYLKVKMGVKFTPPFINFLVTNKCDLRCRHCWLYDDLNVKEVKDLTLPEIDRLTQSMDPVHFLVLAGGEPFVRRDLPEVMQLFYQNNQTRYFAILSDAQFTARMVEQVPRMLESLPEARLVLSLSLDGLEEEHDRIRGRKGAFQKYLQTYRAMKEIQQNYAGRLTLMTCSIFMSETENNAAELYQWIRTTLQPDHINFNLIRQDPAFPHLKQVDLHRYRQLIELQNADDVAAMKPDHCSPLQFTPIMTRELIMKTALEQQRQFDCYASYTGGVIYNDGTVAGCEIKAPFGNLRQYDYDFKQVWFNERARQFRTELKDCFCTHESNCLMPSIAMNPRLYPRLHHLSRAVSRTHQYTPPVVQPRSINKV